MKNKLQTFLVILSEVQNMCMTPYIFVDFIQKWDQSPNLMKNYKCHFESDFFICARGGGMCKWSNVNVKIVQVHFEEGTKISFRILWPCIVSIRWREGTKKMLLIRCFFIKLSVSTCFGHHYAHHQENMTVSYCMRCSAWVCRLWLAVVLWSCNAADNKHRISCILLVLSLHLAFTMHGHKILEPNTLMNIKCALWFSLQFFSETFLILRSIRRPTVTNVHTTSCKVPVLLVTC
jgi:hypothetical protein